jgi:septal ring factor EnvC (AmiA/AmiB activator)
MNILFPSESDEAVATRVDKMDALLQDIQKVLSEIRTSLERARAVEARVEDLEKSVARLQSITMDLRNPGTFPSGSTDRISPLESMVNNLCAMTAEQKAVLDQLVATQEKGRQELKKEILRQESSDELVIQEIDEIVRRR